MIRALLVDDERLALLHLEKMLQELAGIDIIATCTDLAEAMEVAFRQKPDVVFMDIHMPEMNGMRAAELMQEVCPGADIVFVTAYDVYALEAFELNALDYVLKPIQRPRLMKTLQRLEERLPRTEAEISRADETRICCFQSLGYEKNGNPPVSFKWRTTKAQELFAYMLHNRNRFVSKELLLDVLWPDFDPKKAATHLYTTVYQVRQCIKQANLDVQIHNVSGGEGYSLEMKHVRLDVEEWESGVRESGDGGTYKWVEHQKLFELYAGDYFSDYDYIWAESERQRLRSIWQHYGLQLAESHSYSGRLPEALATYQRLIQIQPYCEEAYWGLMKLYDRLGERPAVEAQFRKLKEIMTEELGIPVPSYVEGWYEDWRRGLSVL
ncbi:MAG: hypothetical protein K0R57_4193 [Paenibacillaceae bacterium]|nr:hypothetical protein [Paenibacillaceae bacterium]